MGDYNIYYLMVEFCNYVLYSFFYVYVNILVVKSTYDCNFVGIPEQMGSTVFDRSGKCLITHLGQMNCFAIVVFYAQIKKKMFKIFI